MSMLTTPIRFGAWEGTAYHFDHLWWVTPRPICDFLGVSWSSQYRSIKRLRAVPVVASRATAADGKTYQMMLIPTGMVGRWLDGISPSKCKPEARPALIEMQDLIDAAIEKQINDAFGIPNQADLTDLLHAPIPEAVQPVAGAIQRGRAELLAEPGVARAALMFKLGLPGTKVGALLSRSPYWANKRRRLLIDLFVLEPRRAAPLPPPANEAGQIDLFGTEARNAAN